MDAEGQLVMRHGDVEGWSLPAAHGAAARAGAGRRWSGDFRRAVRGVCL